MLAVEIAVFVMGAVVVLWALFSAVRTVVVPRAEHVLLTRAVFIPMRAAFELMARGRRTFAGRDAVLARFAPLSLFALAASWAVVVMGGFTAMLWATDVRPLRVAIIESGSSLTTLGFRTSDRFAVQALQVVEALIGLGLIALMISFLPTMYNSFSQRERAVSRLSIRAGTPPTPSEMIRRASAIGWLERLEQTWAEWEEWFVEIEESHTSYPALVFFRSPDPRRSWVTSAGAALDTAAMMLSAVDVPASPQAALCLRSGFTSLRSIAQFYAIDFDSDPAPHDSISIEPGEFHAVLDELEAAGVPLVTDREQAWRDFKGWRVNYDAALIGLCSLTSPPEGVWSSDRSVGYRRPPLRRRRRQR
ncbi:MAG: hypothetical protein OEU32_19545 [Acidimicrobiia bacterium]|nr:hypothetical protein [Acidimicrobiia bacterium]